MLFFSTTHQKNALFGQNEKIWDPAFFDPSVVQKLRNLRPIFWSKNSNEPTVEFFSYSEAKHIGTICFRVSNQKMTLFPHLAVPLAYSGQVKMTPKTKNLHIAVNSNAR